jgi:hypothetical protein
MPWKKRNGRPTLASPPPPPPPSSSSGLRCRYPTPLPHARLRNPIRDQEAASGAAHKVPRGRVHAQRPVQRVDPLEREPRAARNPYPHAGPRTKRRPALSCSASCAGHRAPPGPPPPPPKEGHVGHPERNSHERNSSMLPHAYPPPPGVAASSRPEKCTYGASPSSSSSSVPPRLDAPLVVVARSRRRGGRRRVVHPRRRTRACSRSMSSILSSSAVRSDASA